ncbi:hypothetical protein TRP66_01680 [Pseudomonas sp. JDS28PS106]|uniref:hypothetical protein n=1 Tax=Pseudomonas sp. JDS28PS106 TaxID=2497235 RepID=UPI002FD416A5
MPTSQKQRTFDLILDAVLPEFRERVADYIDAYEQVLTRPEAPAEELRASAEQLKGYLRGLNTTRVLGMADMEQLDRRIDELWLSS